MHFGVAHHAINLVFGEPARSRDGDLLLATRCPVFGRDIENAVGVNVEGDFNLRHASRRRGNSFETEVAEALIVARQFTLALQHVNLYGRLIIFSRAKDLALTRRNGRVALDQFRHHTTQGLDTQRKRRHVEQEHIFDLAFQHARLDCRTDCHHFVRVDALVWLFVKDLAHHVDHGRHACLSANQYDFVHLAWANTCVLERLHDRATGALDQVSDQLLQLRPRQRENQVFRAAGISSDERQIDFRLHG